jgi:hypothetical protein
MPGMDNFSQGVQAQAQAPQQQLPLAVRAMNMNPMAAYKARHMVGWNAQRYANTMFEGGVLDTASGASGKRAAVKNFLGKRTGAYSGGVMQDNKSYAFGKSILGDDRTIFGKKLFGTGQKVKAQLTNSPFNPFTFRRFDSVSRLAGHPGESTVYTPFGTGAEFAAKTVLNNKGPIGKMARARFSENYDDAGKLLPGKEIYSGGLFGRINTMGKVSSYEKQVSAASNLTGDVADYSRRQVKIARRGERAAAKLEKFDENLIKLGKATGADFATAGAREFTESAVSSLTGMPIGGIGGITDDVIGGVLKTGAADAEIGAAAKALGRHRAMSQTIKGFLPQGIFNTSGILSGKGAQYLGTETFTKVSNTFAKAMEGSAGPMSPSVFGKNIFANAADDLLSTGGKAGIRQAAGKLGMEALGRKEFGTAAKMAGHYAGTFGEAAGTALGVYGTASMVYDTGKLIGKTIMGGINLGKDALKSMQGSINKPLFGAGFKDNEVAATSRSRGVMAIQNSRLNARSALGSEGAMMAAHFG